MKSILKLLCAILIASFSAFFIFMSQAEKVEAKVCPIGQFPHLQADESVLCKNPVKEKTDKETDNSEVQVNSIKKYILVVAKFLIAFSSVISTLMITYAGYLYVTSEGSPMKLEQAKKTLAQAGVGLLILALSFGLMNMLQLAIGAYD